jgi:Tol biopolymer transport system component
MIGAELGHYRVLQKLGEGGMGQVYAAEDTKLGRRVALKVLPADMASDPERLARFQREARVVAALNHPNIVTMYSVEEALGIQFLTMELVEGKTLAELIPENGLPLEDLLRLAVPLVDAVASAHQQGIVHRDLKPANVMIAADGRLKVLDFGLAKLKAPVAPTDSTYLASQSLTRGHAIVGTAAYMSPEQAEGKPVDHRSDIFSLGVVLYEMACGRQPFEGDTVFSVISSIIKDTPAPVSAVNRAAPLALERIITRALAKDPAARYQTALEMRDDLQQVREQAASVRVVSSLVRAVARSRWTKRAALAVAVVAVLAGTAWYLWRTPAPALRMNFKRLTADPGVEQFPSFLPDGKWVVYAGQQSGNMDIYLLSTSGQTPMNLTKDSPADDDEPAASRDGERIAFRSSRDGGGIFVMGRTGEGPKRITPAGVGAAFNPTWSPDGTEIAYTTENVQLTPLNWEGRSELWVVNVTTSERRQLKVDDAVQASWSPLGHRIAYVARQWKGTDGKAMGSRSMEIATVPSRGGNPVFLTSDDAADWSPVWSPDGRYVYFASERGGSMNLWRVAVDEESGKPLGKPEPITVTAPFLAHPSISADGRHIAYTAKIETQNIQRLGLTPAAWPAVEGQPAEVTHGSRPWANPDPTRDGELVVFYSRDQPEGDVYICRPDGTDQRYLTNDKFVDRMPRWSPDKTWVAFNSDRSGQLDLWKIRQDGSDLQRVGEGFLGVWSPDGARMVASHAGGVPGRTDVYATGAPPGAAATEQLPIPEEALRPFIAVDWSQDAARLAGQIGFSDRGGNGIVLYTFASRNFERLTDFGEWPAWFGDSRRLVFVSKGHEFWVLDTRTKQTKKVYSAIWDTLGPPRLTRDGRTVFFSRRVTEADIYLLSFEGS